MHLFLIILLCRISSHSLSVHDWVFFTQTFNSIKYQHESRENDSTTICILSHSFYFSCHHIHVLGNWRSFAAFVVFIISKNKNIKKKPKNKIRFSIEENTEIYRVSLSCKHYLDENALKCLKNHHILCLFKSTVFLIRIHKNEYSNSVNAHQ